MPGRCFWMTGLSGAGKSTIAEAFSESCARDGINIQVLDGDKVRQKADGNIGFSREARIQHNLNVGSTALEYVKQGHIVVAALISPYTEARRQVRSLFVPGEFIEVHIETPLKVCESRDVKGLYALARAGKIEHFTGISAEYELPERPELRIDTSKTALDDAVATLRQHILFE